NASVAMRRRRRPQRRLLRRPRRRTPAGAVRVLQTPRRDRRSGRASEGTPRMRVAAVQHDIVWEDPPANFARLAPMIERAAASGARLIVLTEMCTTGFSMDTQRTAEPVDGPSTRFLAEQACAHGVWVCGSVPERGPG